MFYEVRINDGKLVWFIDFCGNCWEWGNYWKKPQHWGKLFKETTGRETLEETGENEETLWKLEKRYNIMKKKKYNRTKNWEKQR